MYHNAGAWCNSDIEPRLLVGGQPPTHIVSVLDEESGMYSLALDPFNQPFNQPSTMTYQGKSIWTVLAQHDWSCMPLSEPQSIT
jgi:hypothetical protein